MEDKDIKDVHISIFCKLSTDHYIHKFLNNSFCGIYSCGGMIYDTTTRSLYV